MKKTQLAFFVYAIDILWELVYNKTEKVRKVPEVLNLGVILYEKNVKQKRLFTC